MGDAVKIVRFAYRKPKTRVRIIVVHKDGGMMVTVANEWRSAMCLTKRYSRRRNVRGLRTRSKMISSAKNLRKR